MEFTGNNHVITDRQHYSRQPTHPGPQPYVCVWGGGWRGLVGWGEGELNKGGSRAGGGWGQRGQREIENI